MKFSSQDAPTVWFSLCYIFLAWEFTLSSLARSAAELRVDLLEMWGRALDNNS